MPLKFLLSVVSIPGTRRIAHGRPWPWPLSGLDGKLVPVRRLRSVSHNFSVSLHYKPSYTELSCELQISEFSMSSVGWYFNTFCREWLETIPVNIEISQACCVIRRLNQRNLLLPYSNTTQWQAVSRDLGVAVACCQYRLMCLWQLLGGVDVQ